MNQEQTDKAVKLHIDLHKKHFPDTLLAISDDVAGASRPGASFPITDPFISVGKPDGTPVIALPLAGDDGKRRYRIGTIEVE